MALIGRESFWQPELLPLILPSPLAFMVTAAGGWTGIIYEAGGEFASKEATSHRGPSSPQVSQAGDNEGGGATAPRPILSVFYPPPLPNVALCLRIHCLCLPGLEPLITCGPEHRKEHIPRTSWRPKSGFYSQPPSGPSPSPKDPRLA